jgi:50S ribosomal subunit-associated GTPase HflX
LAKKKQTAMARLQITLRELEPWLNKWRIKVNAAKTQLICFGQRGQGGSITFLG